MLAVTINIITLIIFLLLQRNFAEGILSTMK